MIYDKEKFAERAFHRFMAEGRMTEKEKAEQGLLYNANFDPEINRERLHAQRLCERYNKIPLKKTKKRSRMIKRILYKTGKDILIEQPFRCDFGYRITVGESFYANYNLTILDGAAVTIGSHVFIGPNCGMYAAGHPLDKVQRAEGMEYAYPINIGNDVWIGGDVTILGGVHIGAGVVIGAGSVVRSDIEPDTLAAGNPCRTIRKL